MPLSTYDELQTSILSWLARPGDPLVSPAVPDMIQLFEREATRRLKVGGAEKRASLTALSAAVALPSDFGELRLATSGGVILTYVTPMQLPDGGGPPAHYTIIGNEMRLGPAPSGGCTIEIVYQSGVPPLSGSNPSNWLLAQHPDCYLFGSLVEAESFIGSDDRIPLWAQRREAAFSSIESADRKARWGGAPLSIRAEGVSGGNGTAAGDWTSAPPVPIPIVSIVAGDGLIGGGSEGIVTVSLSTPVTIGRGGTGGTNALDARLNLGAAPLDGPVFTGDPQAPTPAPGDVDTSIATTGFVNAALVAQVLAGDVTGPTSATAVVGLQGHPVANTAPTGSQVLQWSGTAWGPASIAGSGTVTSISAGAGITVTPNPIVGTGSVALTVPVSVANGGTGSTTAAAALTALGAAPLNAPVFSGDARAVTPATADNDTSIATTAYVQAQGYATGAAVTAADNLRVLKAGDTMSGPLTVNSDVVCTNLSAASAIGINGVQFATGDAAGAGFSRIYDNSGNLTFYLGNNSAQQFNIYAQTQHAFANRTAATTWVTFDTSGTKNLSGAWVVISDPAVKEDIAPYTRGLDAVLALVPVMFRYSAGTPFAAVDQPSRPLMGLLADQVQPHVPEIVGRTTATIKGTETEVDTLEPGNLIYALINAVKELSTRIEALEGGAAAPQRRRQ